MDTATKGTTDVKKLNATLEKHINARRTIEAQWKLNDYFFAGRQYYEVVPRTNRVLSLPATSPNHNRKRATLNIYTKAILALLAKYTKTDPIWQGIPSSDDTSDINAAVLAEQVIKHVLKITNFGSKRDTAVLCSILNGQGYLHWCWDPEARTPIEVIYDPEALDEQGKPTVVTDPARKEALEEIANAGGPELIKETLYQGDIVLEALSPYEVVCQGAKNPRDAHTVTIMRAYDPKYVNDRWVKSGDEVVAADATSDVNSNIFYQANESNPDKHNSVVVKQQYCPPTTKNPQGRYTVWCGSDRILEDGPWPYDSPEMPIVKIPGITLPGAPYDYAVASDLIDPQRNINRTASQVIEYKNLVNRGQIWAPIGSFDASKMNNEVGGINWFQPMGINSNIRPEREQLSPLPNDYLDFIKMMKEEMYDMLGVNDISRMELPPDISGIGISLIQEAGDTAIYPQIRAIERESSRSGKIVLNLVKQYYTEERLMAITDENGGTDIRAFMNSDIAGVDDVVIVPDSTLPHMKAAVDALIDSYVKDPNIQFDPYEALGLIGTGAGTNRMLKDHNADKNKQTREINMALSGKPIPDPINGVDDDQIHIDTLKLFIKSPTFEQCTLAIQEAIMKHYKAHMDYVNSLPVPLPDNVKTTIQYKADLTTSEATQVLDQAGVQGIDPEVVAQEKALEAQEKGQSMIMQFENQRKLKYEEAAGKEALSAAFQGRPVDPTKGIDPLGPGTASGDIMTAGQEAAQLVSQQPQGQDPNAQGDPNAQAGPVGYPTPYDPQAQTDPSIPQGDPQVLAQGKDPAMEQAPDGEPDGAQDPYGDTFEQLLNLITTVPEASQDPEVIALLKQLMTTDPRAQDPQIQSLLAKFGVVGNGQ